MQHDNDRGGEANAAMNSYIEWKDRLVITIKDLRALDCTPSAAQKNEVASVIEALEASNTADDLWTGEIYDRPGNLAIDLIMRGEKLHDIIRNRCVIGGSNNEWLDRTNPQRFVVPATANATSDDSMKNLLIYGTGGVLLLGAVLCLARLQSVKRQLKYAATTASHCTDAVTVYAKSFFKAQTDVVDSDNNKDLEQRVQLVVR
jgi:hypothetical protein